MLRTKTYGAEPISNRDWERIGSAEPYFGVLSDEKYLASNLDELGLAEFFASGDRHIQEALKVLEKHFDSPARFERVLDYGCGVGRVLLPLARISESVTGIDVSKSMLQEAKLNCQKRGVSNVAFLQGEGALSALQGSFDLVHSVLVFQHIPCQRGEKILRHLIAALREGGFGLIHIPYFCRRSWLRKVLYRAVCRFTLLRYLRNIMRGRRLDAPYVQMNEYDLNRLFYLFQEMGCHAVYTRHCYSSAWGLLVFFQKKQLGDGCPY